GDRPAVLVDQTAGATHRVRLLTTDARGRTRVARTYASPAQPFGGHLWATSRGDLVAAWSDHPRGSGRRVVVATGLSLQRRQVLATDVEDVRGLDLAVNARGDALAVFVRRAGDARTLAVSYRPTGGAFGPVQTVGPIDDLSPRAMIDANGVAAAAFNGPGGLFIADRPAGATASFGAPSLVAQGSWLRPAGVLKDGRAVLAWISTADGSLGRLVIAERPAAGQPFSAPALVGGGRPILYASSLAVDGARTLVAWNQSPGGADPAGETVFAAATGSTWRPAVTTGGPTTNDRDVELLGAGVMRPGMEVIVSSLKPGRSSVLQTATVRRDGTLAPRSTVATGLAGIPDVAAAQGTHHTWVAFTRLVRGVNRVQLRGSAG
ncbi:MAG TPA: hypothetical protein VNT55_06575, partial [Baekduia sp.]|nr:hypothetical protein [Baekduia sp.]